VDEREAERAAYLERHRVAEQRRRDELRRDPIRYAQFLVRDRPRAREATRRYRARLRADPQRAQAAAEKRRAADRVRWKLNHEALLARQRKYTDEHRQEIYARNRQYEKRNREKLKAKRKARFLRDPDGNRARERERARARYQRNPEGHLAYMKAWRAANPERARLYVRLSNQRRRAKAGGDFIRVEDWQRLVKKYKGRCAYCGEQSAAIEADHRIPLSRGGRNTIANIVPACRRCNRRKRTKTDVEFRAWLKKVG
jgi:5-methylcytosine-specific restriction endonuclease McrA